MASTMLKTVKELFAKMQPTLPMLVMVGILTSTELTCLLLAPVLFELVEWGYSVFKQQLTSTECTLEVPDYAPYSGGKNLFYRNITFALEHHNLLILAKKLRIEAVTSNTNQKHKIGSTVWQFETPVIEPSPGFKIPFKHHNFDVQIELIEITTNDKYARTERKYTISSKNQSHLDAFITYANGLQLQYAQKIYHENKEPVVYQLYKGVFKENTINVKKTFSNIFLDSVIKRKLKSQLDSFINGKERYDELGIAYRMGYLLSGLESD